MTAEMANEFIRSEIMRMERREVKEMSVSRHPSLDRVSSGRYVGIDGTVIVRIKQKGENGTYEMRVR